VLALRNRADQRIQIDIDLARRPHMAHFKRVGLEAIFHQPDFLDADQLLPGVGNDEAGGWRPHMPDMGKGEIPALVNVSAGDQAKIDGAEHFDHAAARRHRNIADRRRRKFGIAR
jgi:hypothetical protein